MRHALNKRSPIVMAQRIYAEGTLYARNDLRRQFGVVGEIKPLDRVVSGERGRATVSALYRRFYTLAKGGMSVEDMQRDLQRTFGPMAQLAYEHARGDGLDGAA